MNPYLGLLAHICIAQVHQIYWQLTLFGNFLPLVTYLLALIDNERVTRDRERAGKER